MIVSSKLRLDIIFSSTYIRSYIPRSRCCLSYRLIKSDNYKIVLFITPKFDFHFTHQLLSTVRRVASPSFLVSPRDYFVCPALSFRNEGNCMKKSARVSEKLVSPGLPGLQVATRLTVIRSLGLVASK